MADETDDAPPKTKKRPAAAANTPLRRRNVAIAAWPMRHVSIEFTDAPSTNVPANCGAGIGRTGMFTMGARMALVLSTEEARHFVRAAGSEPERPAQERALHRLAQDSAADVGSQGAPRSNHDGADGAMEVTALRLIANR